jgi:hypothetical protein
MLKISTIAMIVGPVLCVLQVTTGLPASALDRHIQLTNATHLAIVELYASYVGTGVWQQDILGDDFLAPGNSIVVDIDDGSDSCRFDLKAVFDDGTEVIRRNINICGVEYYMISYR